MAEGELELAGVTSGYGAMHILHGIDLALRPGERVAIVGRNGAGKTTLMSTIMGQCRLHAGRIAWDGTDITALPAHRRARAGIGLVPQTRDVFPSLTVEQNLISGLKAARDRDVEPAFALFPRLKERRANLAGNLSGGEQQMLSIARALLGRPRLLLLDEPLEGLAPVICDELMDVFQTLARAGSGLTIVLVEQHLAVALDFAERIVLLDHGRIAFDGPPALAEESGALERGLGVGRSHSAAITPTT